MSRTELSIPQRVAIVRRLVVDLVHPADVRDDAAQDVLAAAIESPPREATSFRAWATTLLRRWSTRRRVAEERRRRRESGALERPRENTDPAAIATQRELLKSVVDAVYELEEPYRETLLLRYLEDLEVDAIAKRMDVPRETVRTRIKRGLQRVRERLDAGHGSRGAWLAPLVRFARPAARAALAARVAAGIVAVTLGALAIAPDRDDGIRGRTTAEPIAVTAPRVLAPQDASPAVSEREEVASPASVAPISGRVVTESGAPIRDALVRLFDGRLRGSGDAPPNALVVTRTDAGGRFATPARSGASFVVALTAEGFGSRTAPIAGSGDAGDIELRESFAIHGIVHDLDRRPVAGATVRFRTLRYVVEEELVAISDHAGNYRIEGASDPFRDVVTGESAIQLFAEHEDFAPVFESRLGLSGFDDAGDLRFDVWLARGATLEGRVLDAETGAGIPGAVVTLHGSGSHNVFVAGRIVESTFRRPELARATTDANGRYVLSRVPSFAVHRLGHHSPAEGERVLGYLSFRSEGALPIERSTEVNVPDEGAVVTFDLRGLPLGFVRGRLVDERGAPVPGHEIGAATEEVEDSAPARLPRWFGGNRTDDAGRFEIALPLRRDADERIELSTTTAAGECVERIVEAARAGRVVEAGDLVLASPVEPFVLAVVTVSNDRDEPIEDAAITAIEVERETQTEGWGFARARTDEDGVARIALHPGARERIAKQVATFRLCVEAHGFEPGFSPLVSLSGLEGTGPAQLGIAMRRATLAAPRTRASPPRTGARVLVTLLDADSGQPVLHPRSLCLVDDRGREDRSFTAIEPGVFELFGAAPGEWRLVANVTGYAAHAPVHLAVPESGVVAHTLALERGRVLRGVVRATDGASLDGARLFLHPIGSGRFAAATLDATQAFEFTSVRPGERYRAEAFGGDAGLFVARRTVVIDAGPASATETTIEVEPAGHAFVTSKDPRLAMGAFPGRPDDAQRELGARSFVVVLDGAGFEVARRRCPIGSTGLPVLLPFGDYTFRLEVPGETPREQRVRLADSRQVDVIFPGP